MFEELLVKELEDALLCSEGSIGIEEIRRLDDDHPRLKEAYYARLELIRQQQK